MNVDRLFHVLVMGGAALGAAACADEKPDGTSGAGGSSSTGTQASASSGNQGAGGLTAGQGGAAQSTASGAGGSGETVASSGAGPLTCSDMPSPADACGCPCCWMANCLNTEPCCESFCNLGDMGAGCCGG